MYDSESLAFTGSGLVLGGVMFDMAWVVAGALTLVVIGLLLVRFGRPKRGS